MVSSGVTRGSPADRTPRSAVVFGIVLVCLAVAFLCVAFVYGRGWSDVLTALVGIVVIVFGIAFCALMAWYWTRGWRRPQ